MRVRATPWLVVLGISSSVAACFQYPDTSARFDDEIIGTRYDVEAKFSSYSTFNIIPTVKVIDATEEPSDLPAAQAQPLLDAVVKNLTERGYRQVGNDLKPDLGVQLTVISSLNAEQVCFPYYYWGYGYYGGYWGYGGYPYYAPYGCYTSTWKTGTLAVDIVDLKAENDRPTPEPLPVDAGIVDGGLLPDGGTVRPLRAVWLSVTYGVASSAANVNVQRGVEGINQSFVQSPYLKK